MNNQSAESLTKLIWGYRKLHSMHLDARPDLDYNHYDLLLVLEHENGHRLRVALLQISNLRVAEFGGGLVQLLFLKIENLSEQQLDGVQFRVREIEDDRFSCHCFDIKIVEE